jgi:hypothetical protein
MLTPTPPAVPSPSISLAPGCIPSLVGGTDPGAGNVIGYNGGYGVRITTGSGNAVQQNAIFANAAGGIGLLNGANHHQRAPVLLSAVSAGGVVTITGTVAGSPGQTLTLEFFDNLVRARQGEAFLGSTVLTSARTGRGVLPSR